METSTLETTLNCRATSAAKVVSHRVARAALTVLVGVIAPGAALARPTITNVNQSTTHTTIQQAVNAPRFHHQWLPDSLRMEQSFPSDIQEELKKMGYVLDLRKAMGRTEVIKVLPDGKFEGVADSRGDDAAEGF